MYQRHFGLAKAPFRITPDPEFFFPGGNRGAVLEALVYAVARGEGMVKVVGEVGSGKTMLCRMLERALPPHCEVVYLANPRLAPHEVLHAIAFELGLAVAVEDTRLKVLHVLHQHLLAKHAENRRVVMFVEEAQGVPVETLEEIRLLSNLETTQEKLLQIVLFGQPELDEKLDLHEIRQLRERITHGFVLAPLATAQIRDYVNTRLRASGYRGHDLFTSAALRELERHSGGLLRRINILADKALLAAFAGNATRVTPAHVRRAAQDSEFERPRGRARAWSVPLALLVLVLGVVVWWLGMGRENFPWRAFGGAPAVTAPGRDGPPAVTMPSAAEPLPPAGSAPARDAASAEEYDDDRPAQPTVSAITGLVGLDHLRPLRRARPAVPD